MKGIVLIFLDSGKLIHEYLPILSTLDSLKNGTLEKMTQHKDKIWLKNMYWRSSLSVFSVLVLFIKQWYNLVFIIQMFIFFIERLLLLYEHHSFSSKKATHTLVLNYLYGCIYIYTNINVKVINISLMLKQTYCSFYINR